MLLRAPEYSCVFNKFPDMGLPEISFIGKSCVFQDIMPCSPLKPTNVLQAHTASIFKVKEEPKEGTSMKQVAVRTSNRMSFIDSKI
jgi:hypothetical protein